MAGCQQGPYILGLCRFALSTAFVASQEHHLDHTASSTSIGHFPVCFGRESFMMLRDPAGLRQGVRMMRESLKGV